jgi:restriction system protein
MLPLLQYASDGNTHYIRDAIEALAEWFGLTEAERAERLGSAKKFKFDDRVQWANTYLKKAGLLQSAGRGYFQVTQQGLDVLATNPRQIDRNYLMQFQGFAEFITESRPKKEQAIISETESVQTPEETLLASYETLRERLAQELLETVLAGSPSFFENLVVDLLVAMGYGGSQEDAGRAVGGTGDDGVDGVINEDRLGFDSIYIQAKRWSPTQTVGRPEIQKFVGSLVGNGVSKGIFITTSRFSDEAIDYAGKLLQQKVILVDGKQLSQLMIDYDVGVLKVETYTLKRLDAEYFQLQ